jgi:probable phosphoglycerate mutase
MTRAEAESLIDERLSPRRRDHAHRVAAEAVVLARRFGENGLKLDSLISSDLLRARQTADAIAGVCRLPVTSDPQWRERGLGPWEGKTVDQVNIWRMAAGEFDPPGAEPSAAFRERVHDALLAAAVTCPPDGCIAIVTHGGPCRTVLKLLAEGELPMANGSAKPAIEMIGNCSIMQLEASTRGDGLLWRLLRMNDTEHLGKTPLPAVDAG